MSHEIEKQLQQLRLQLDECQRQLTYLQMKVKQPIDKPIAESKPSEVPSQTMPVHSKESVELTFGKYWLSRIGVVLFVVGIALLISYSFQYFTAYAKIGLGFVLAAGFLITGHRLVTQEKWQKFSWGLLAGGWGLMYLTTFAMYYIPITRVLPNQWCAIAALMFVGVIAIIYNLRYSSWVATALTYSLMFWTLGLTPLTEWTLLLWTMVIGSLCFIVMRFDWPLLARFGIFAAALLQCWWMMRGSFTAGYDYTIGVFISVLSWACITYAVLRCYKGIKDNSNQWVRVQLINSCIFIFLSIWQITHISNDYQMIVTRFLIACSCIHAAFAFYYKSDATKTMSRCCGLIAWILLPLAMATAAIDNFLAVAWTMQALLMWWLGVKDNSLSYRFIAGVLLALAVGQWLVVDYFNVYAVKTGLVVITALLYISLKSNYLDQRQLLDVGESRAWQILTGSLALILMFILSSKQFSQHWLTVIWTFEGLVAMLLGFYFRHKMMRLIAIGALSISALRLLFIDMAGMTTLVKIAAVLVFAIVLIGISFIYGRYITNNESNT